MRLTDFEHNERTGKIAALGSVQFSKNRGGVQAMSELCVSIGDYRDLGYCLTVLFIVTLHIKARLDMVLISTMNPFTIGVRNRLL